MNVQLMIWMAALAHQKKGLVLILLKKPQHFVWVDIVFLIIFICLLMEKKSSFFFVFIFDKFLFLFLSNLQAQLEILKRHKFLYKKQLKIKQTKKKLVQRYHTYKHIDTVLLVKSPFQPVAFSFSS